MKNNQVNIDEYDWQILRILQRNNRFSAEQIAAEVHLSPSAIQRRLNKLRRNKIIEAEIALISPEAVGLNLIAVVEISFEGEHRKILKDFKKQMLSAPEVLQCYYVTGEADFIVIAITKNIKHYEKFTQHFFIDNPIVKKFRTSIVVKKIKFGFVMPF